MRAVLHRDAVIRLRVDDESGALVAPDALPTLVVTDPDGASVQTSEVRNPGLGLYEATLGPQDALTKLVATWSWEISGVEHRTTDQVSVVPRRLIPPHRMRDEDQLSSLPTAALLELSDLVDDWFRDALGFPAVTEWTRITVRTARTSSTLFLPGVTFPHALRAVVVDGTPIDHTDLVLSPGGGVYRPEGWRQGSIVTVDVEHGGPPDFQPNPPGHVVRGAVVLARYAARSNNYPERARQVATEGALITFSTPSPDRPTGLPEVDTAISRYRFTPVV